MDDRRKGHDLDPLRARSAGWRSQRGIDVEPLLAQAGISPVLLDSAQARVSPANYGMLWNLIAQALDDEFFGMDSHPMKSGSLTLLCHSVLHSGHAGNSFEARASISPLGSR